MNEEEKEHIRKNFERMQPEPVARPVEIATALLDEIEITRSFSRKVQQSQYEPIEMFASVKAMVSKDSDINAISEQLQAWAVDQVERDLEKYNKPKEDEIPF